MRAVAAPIDVSGLRDDGDTVTMPDGRMLRLKVTGDDLCEFGFVVVTLELCDGTDAYGRPIVVKAESLGGNECDCMSEPYGAELVADLVTELLGIKTEAGDAVAEWVAEMVSNDDEIASRLEYIRIS
jgi:hypothetical protein